MVSSGFLEELNTESEWLRFRFLSTFVIPAYFSLFFIEKIELAPQCTDLFSVGESGIPLFNIDLVWPILLSF